MKSSSWLVLGAILICALVAIGLALGGTDGLQGNLRNAKVGNFGVELLPSATTFQSDERDVEFVKFKVATKNQTTTTGATFTIEITGSGWLHAYSYPDMVGVFNIHDLEIVDSAGNLVSETKFREFIFPYNNELVGGGNPQETVNSFAFLEFNELPGAGTEEIYTLRGDIERSDSFYDDPTTIKVTLDSLFGTTVNLTGPTIVATP